MPKKAAVAKVDLNQDCIAAIKQAVIDGEKDEITALVDRALQEGKTSDEITADGLTAAMTDIGEDFGSGRMFLPQVLLSAETMRTAFNRLKELFPATQDADKGTIVIATTPVSASSTSARTSMPRKSSKPPSARKPISSASAPS